MKVHCNTTSIAKVFCACFMSANAFGFEGFSESESSAKWASAGDFGTLGYAAEEVAPAQEKSLNLQGVMWELLFQEGVQLRSNAMVPKDSIATGWTLERERGDLRFQYRF